MQAEKSAARLELRAQVKLASKVIAPYWPIRTFVHHNPLHEMEHMPFEEAVEKAQHLLGGNGYLPGEIYRQRWRQGLVSTASIDSAISAITENTCVLFGDRQVSQHEFYKALLLNGTQAPTANVLSLWQRDLEKDALDKVAATMQKEPGWLDGGHQDYLSVTRDAVHALGRSSTLVGWIDRTFGTELESVINRELSRWCTAFLDEGEAGWALPARNQTFFGCWKSLSGLEILPEWNLKNWQASIKSLPERADDAIIEALQELGIPQDLHVEYLACHLASLPGWVAFIKWRELHSEYPWQTQYPIDLTQFLAVRLFYERLLAREFLKDKFRIDGNYESIKSFMEAYPTVYFLFRQKAAGHFSDADSREIDRIWHRWKRPTFQEWQKASERYLPAYEGTAKEVQVKSTVWQLRAVCRCLNIPLEALIQNHNELITLAQWLKNFPEERHGSIWLNASEADYREKLLCDAGQVLQRNELEQGRGFFSKNGFVRPDVQALFCIDIRSEPFRRHLESIGAYETFGFAGFFICFIKYLSLGSNYESEQYPVIMKSRNVVREVPRPYHQDKLERYQIGSKLLGTIKNLLHDLKGNVITPYVTVESLGWLYSLPFILKTAVPAYYRNLAQWLKHRIEEPIATTLTVDKLPIEEVQQMILNNQLAVIKQAVISKFGMDHSQISYETLVSLRRLALQEQDPGGADASVFNHISSEDLAGFVDELRHVHHITARDTSKQKERLTRTGFTLEQQVFTIDTALRMMGLTKNFARVVLVCAHGSSSDNNPFESALDCGACGGNEGNANARVFAAMANKVEVRQELLTKGIEIPADTYFIAGRVDTTTDQVELLDLEDVPSTHRLDIARLATDLKEAGRQTSQERCAQFPELTSTLAPEEAKNKVIERSCSWSQVRPEWGLSGNASFIIAPREMTKSIDLKGRAFLHSYDYLTDPEGKLLEVLLTAPQVVTQWINMEHYFSTVDNEVYGAGNKIYHNVTGRIGVMSGTLSDLRTGLAWQTVMDGKNPYHDPLRLTTVVDSPLQQIEEIIGRHETLQRFYHNEWVHLIALVREEGAFYQYFPTGQWRRVAQPVNAPVHSSERESAKSIA